MSDMEAIVSWNAAFNRDPAAQYAHIEKLEEKLRDIGAASVLFCLNELTNTHAPDTSSLTFQSLLESQGYSVNSRPTTLFRRSNRYEGIGFASRDPHLVQPISGATFLPTVTRQAHRHKLHNVTSLHREHQRQVATIATPDKTIHTTHASYYSPAPEERRRILQHAALGAEERLLAGDLNTGLNQRLITEAEAAGWVKLRPPNGRATFPLRFGPLPVWGLELDHALATPPLAARSQLQIADRGPSDHHPLIIVVEN